LFAPSFARRTKTKHGYASAIAIGIVTALLVHIAPPARFHAAVCFSLPLLLLFGWAGSWQGEESGVRQTLKRALGSRYSISAPLPVWRDIDY
jgi:hypothetical protein